MPVCVWLIFRLGTVEPVGGKQRKKKKQCVQIINQRRLVGFIGPKEGATGLVQNVGALSEDEKWTRALTERQAFEAGANL